MIQRFIAASQKMSALALQAWQATGMCTYLSSGAIMTKASFLQ